MKQNINLNGNVDFDNESITISFDFSNIKRIKLLKEKIDSSSDVAHVQSALDTLREIRNLVEEGLAVANVDLQKLHQLSELAISSLCCLKRIV